MAILLLSAYKSNQKTVATSSEITLVWLRQFFFGWSFWAL